ncbi:MAG: flap endonuclease, partial [Dehalococcoidia bacterium]|nr:flap endonuclease [Dehalococcoidia bacterium]
IPDLRSKWDLKLRGINAVAASLSEHRDNAMLYKELATLRLDVPLPETLDQLEWRGVLGRDYLPLCRELGFSALSELPHKWADE